MRVKKNGEVIAVHPWTMNICVSFIYQPHGGMSHLSLAGHPVAMNICSSHVPQRGFTPVTFHLHDKKPVNQSNYSLSTQWLHRKKHLKIPWKARLVFCNLWSECDVAPDTFPFQHELYKYTRGFFQCIYWFPFVSLVLLQSICTYVVMSELTGRREKGSKRMSWKYNKFKKIKFI